MGVHSTRDGVIFFVWKVCKFWIHGKVWMDTFTNREAPRFARLAKSGVGAKAWAAILGAYGHLGRRHHVFISFAGGIGSGHA